MEGMDDARFARGTITCRGCGVKFETVYTVVRTRFEPKKYAQKEFCSKCDPQGPSLEPVRQRNDRAERWVRLCKAIESPFAGVVTDDLSTELAYEVINYEYNPQGLFFAGRESNAPLYAALRLLFMQGRSVRILTAARFDSLSRQAREGDATESWINTFFSINVVAFQDFGEVKLTEQTARDFLDIMRLRARWGSPVFGSTNFRGVDLASQSPALMSTEILNTLRDSCKIIKTGII
jgi:hypothetical protein